MFPPKDIMVAVDLEAADYELIQYGLHLTTKLDAKLWIVHIAEPDPDFVGYGIGPQYIRDAREHQLEEEHGRLHHYIEKLAKEKVESTALLIRGPTAETLENEIELLGIDLLIMGNRRRGFLYDLVAGHTSTRLLKHLKIPVLIVPLP